MRAVLMVMFITFAPLCNAQDKPKGESDTEECIDHSVRVKKIKLILGTSGCYIANYMSGYPRAVNFREYNWRSSLAVPIRSIRVGVDYQRTWGNGIITGLNSYNTYGTFVQYVYNINQIFNAYGGLNYKHGDYCTDYSISDEPYRKSGLNYIGVQIGTEFKLINCLYADVNSMFNHMVNKVPNKSGFNYYTIGLKYFLNVRRKTSIP